MAGESPSLTVEQEHQRLVTALRESEILRELAELLASSLDLKYILHVLTKRTAEVCEVERCSVWLLDDTRNVFCPATYHLTSQSIAPKSIQAADHIWSAGTILFDEPELYQALKHKGMIVIDDLRVKPKARRVAETFLVRSTLLVALMREGRIVGMLSLDDPAHIRTFSAEQQQLARAIGQQAAIAIDNARIYQQAQTERKRAERLIERARAIYQVALTVNAGEDLKTVLQIATQHLVRGLNADGGAIALLEDDILYPLSTTKAHEAADSEATIRLADIASCRQAAQAGKPLFIRGQEMQDIERQWYRKLGLDTILIVPLVVGTNLNVGFAFATYAHISSAPSKGEHAFAQDIAAQCALAIEKAHLLANVRQTAALATERANTLSAVFQAMTEGITVLNQQGQVVACNEAASQFMGNPSNVIGELSTFLQRHPTSTVHGQTLSEEDFPLSRALKGEYIRGERFVTTRSDGAERVLEMNVTHMLDDNKQRLGLVSAFHDVTEQMLFEQRIRQALETMLHVAEAVSGITDIKDILQSVLEKTLTTLNCARGLVQLYDAEQQVFTPFFSIGFDEQAEIVWLQEQSFWLSAEADEHHRYRTRLLAGHAVVINGEEYPFEPELLTHTLILAAPIMHHDRLLGMMMLDRSPSSKSGSLLTRERYEFNIWDMAVIEGIAQLAGLAIGQARWQQLATSARTSEAAMREANALKDEFLAITAHEFRTPLTVVLAHCQMALRVLRKLAEQPQAGRLRESLMAIEEQTHQLTNIVNTFLEVTQINRGQLAIQSAPVDIAELIKQVVTNHSSTSEIHELSYSIAACEHPYLVIGDSFRLAQVLANLIQNAIKYSPLGGPITVSAYQYESAEEKEIKQRTIEICVADSGIGIPHEAQSRLFERFYRAPNIQGSKTKGIGLGLYIVAELLHMHRGAIRVASSGVLGEGSRFIFTLPALESKTQENEQTTEMASESCHRNDGV